MSYNIPSLNGSHANKSILSYHNVKTKTQDNNNWQFTKSPLINNGIGDISITQVKTLVKMDFQK